MIWLREIEINMADKFRKLITPVLASFLVFSQTACGSNTASGEPAAEAAPEAAGGYTYTTPEQLKTDLEELSAKAVAEFSQKKDEVVQSVGSTLEEYEENYSNVPAWFAEEHVISEQLYNEYESVMRDTYRSIAASAADGSENWQDDLTAAYDTFDTSAAEYYYNVFDCYSEIDSCTQQAIDLLFMGDVIDGDKYEQLSAQVFDDIEAAQFLDSMSYDKFHGLVYKSYGELNGAITDENYDTDKLLDQIKEQVIAEVEEDYADKSPDSFDTGEADTGSSEISKTEYSPYGVLNGINGDYIELFDEALKADPSSLEIPEEASYEEIHDKYAALIREAGEKAYAEYQSESAGVSDPEELASLCKEKITVIAETAKEAYSVLCAFSVAKDTKNPDMPIDFMEWAEKLDMVYVDEANKIYEDFLDKTGL